METALNLDGTIDDFVFSPVNTDEVVTRVKRLLNKKVKPVNPEQIIVGNLVIDTVKYEVHIGDRLISLTFREYELLKFLATNSGRVFTRDALLNGVWGEDFFGGDRTVDVHIRRLRGKIEDQTHTYIKTVRNIGYRFVKKA
jgi:DNA-binding response OmpR family regulator